MILKQYETKDGNLITIIESGELPKGELPQLICYENENEKCLIFCPTPSSEIFQSYKIDIPCFLCKHGILSSNDKTICTNQKSKYFKLAPINPKCDLFQFLEEEKVLVAKIPNNGQPMFYSVTKEAYYASALEEDPT